MKLMHKLTVKLWDSLLVRLSCRSAEYVDEEGGRIISLKSKQKLSWSSLNEHLINHLYTMLSRSLEDSLDSRKKRNNSRRRRWSEYSKANTQTLSTESVHKKKLLLEFIVILRSVDCWWQLKYLKKKINVFFVVCRVVSLLLPVSLQFFFTSYPAETLCYFAFFASLAVAFSLVGVSVR